MTGGAVRIGREIALRLARLGMHIGLHYGHSHDAAEKSAAEIRQLGVHCLPVSADFNHPVPAAKAVFDAVQPIGPASVLINSAAIFEPGTLAQTTPEQWQRHLDINLAAPLFLTQRFAEQLPAETHGVVINIVDWRGTHPIPGHTAYTIAKAGLVAQTQLLAQELGPRIRVNGIAPGAILPPPGMSAEEFARRGHRNPLQRNGDAAQIADAVEYLLRAEFVTGQILHVTGGEELCHPTISLRD